MAQFSLRTKLFFSFSIVILIGVFLSVVVGLHLIGNTIIEQAQDKVRLDLNSAREVYQEECGKINDVVRLTAVRFFMKDALTSNDRKRLLPELQRIREEEFLDVLTLTDREGRVLVRASNPEVHGDRVDNELVYRVLEKREEVVSTLIVAAEELSKESDELAQQARLQLIPTPKAPPRVDVEETSGMMIEAAAPVLGYQGELLGVLYGGRLLNQNHRIVDKVKDIVYRGERYKGKDIGTATIFQGDLRIATNVLNADGSRAIGTRVSQEVYDQVIGRGIPWVGRAFVVNDWYITAYEPLRDFRGNIAGMIYVGMLEAPYGDLKNRVVFTFLAIAFLSFVLLTVIALLTTNRIVRPLKELSRATRKVAQGDLSYRLRVESRDEIGQLAGSFNQMTVELQKATENYQMLTRTLEDKVQEKTEELKRAQDQLIQTEKLTSLGKFAAGIAHEVNNPLTSILLNSHLVAERLKADDRLQENLKLIIDETTRCGTIVRGLLDFSRQTPPQRVRHDVNKVIDKVLLLLNSQILMHQVEVSTDLQGDLPAMMIDVNQMTQVLTNIILNALDAMPQGGHLSIRSGRTSDGKNVEVRIADTGRGIPRENLSRIFDPFFTTKGMAGTGLGLSVSYGIIQGHGGTIAVHSEVDKGTVMIVRLPAETTPRI